MTQEEENREKEIAAAAELEYFVTKAEEFAWIHGAEWADQHLRKGLWDSEKVISWIENNYGNYESTYADIGGYIYSDFQIDKFIEGLRKAMED